MVKAEGGNVVQRCTLGKEMRLKYIAEMRREYDVETWAGIQGEHMRMTYGQ